MADVAQKCITANNIKNNSSISAVMKNGTVHTNQYGFNKVTSVEQIETKLTDRFDDVNFYQN